jgi:hypothetical protein
MAWTMAGCGYEPPETMGALGFLGSLVTGIVGFFSSSSRAKQEQAAALAAQRAAYAQQLAVYEQQTLYAAQLAAIEAQDTEQQRQQLESINKWIMLALVGAAAWYGIKLITT